MFEGLNLIPIDLVIGTILSTYENERKEKIVNCALKLMEDSLDKDIIQKIFDLYTEAHEWPSYETIFNCGFTRQVFPISAYSFNVADFINFLSEQTVVSKKNQLFQNLVNLTRDINSLSVKDLLERINSAIAPLETQKVGVSISTQDAYERQLKEPPGVATFIGPIDEVTGSLIRANTTTIAGYVGGGKSSMGIHLLYSNTVYSKQRGVYLTLEQPSYSLMYYMLSRHTLEEKWGNSPRVEKSKLIKSLMTNDEKRFIFDSVEPDLMTNPDYGKFKILDRSCFKDLTFQGIKSRLLQIEEEWAAPIDYLIIDYIQKFSSMSDITLVTNGRKSNFNPANEYVVFFQDLAMNFNGHTFSNIILAQTNRSGYVAAKESTPEGMYDIPALSDLNTLDRESAFIMFLYSNSNLRDSGEIMINLPKNRFGETISEPITTRINFPFTQIGEGALIRDSQQQSDNIANLLGMGGDFGL
jgi:hypothetical protein